MKRKSLSELVADVLHAKRFEPEMRNHDGMRHHGHRFPIKGGISGFEVMARNIEKNNPLFQRLKKGAFVVEKGNHCGEFESKDE